MWSFALNARFNFRTRDRIRSRFIAFCAVAVLAWTVSAAMLHVAVVQLGIDKYVAKSFTIVVIVLLQYNLNRLVSFRRPKAFASG